ncbi:hypothetical protein SKAU_G00312120 [Synaphobranchus kaupii]|uniref:Uncharacterized protein n=1 Tax=Synaphobranchus kaupii TaxID=118154 RepID=A0A9Q1ERU4_SYNKA|nr:hypothetical protein SKAU_G00312120 [Synaphobranchus kaupii]
MDFIEREHVRRLLLKAQVQPLCQLALASMTARFPVPPVPGFQEWGIHSHLHEKGEPAAKPTTPPISPRHLRLSLLLPSLQGSARSARQKEAQRDPPRSEERGFNSFTAEPLSANPHSVLPGSHKYPKKHKRHEHTIKL